MMWELIVDSAVGMDMGVMVAVSTVVSDKISVVDFVLVGILVDDKILVDSVLVGTLVEGTGDVETSCNCVVKQ